MVVKSSKDAVVRQLDLAYVGFSLGLRVNELVMARTIRAGFTGVRESHGYVIQHVIESDRTITELAKRMEVTQQAASKIVAELIHLGILEAVPAKDRRAKRIRLSHRGWSCVKLGRRVREQITSRLIAAVGREACEQAKSTLVTCLRALGGIERIRSRRIRAPR
jgi:DNA-binding MarR family transcriptional regulator